MNEEKQKMGVVPRILLIVDIALLAFIVYSSVTKPSETYPMNSSGSEIASSDKGMSGSETNSETKGTRESENLSESNGTRGSENLSESKGTRESENLSESNGTRESENLSESNGTSESEKTYESEKTSESAGTSKEETNKASDPERPDISDFSWSTDYNLNGKPSEAVDITDYSDITGQWKGYIHQKTGDSVEDEDILLLNFTVKGNSDEAVLVADWFSSTNVASITVTDCSEDEDTVFSGAFDETGLTVFAGESVISFYDLYSLDGVQYAVGLMEDEDKKTSPVYMMR